MNNASGSVEQKTSIDRYNITVAQGWGPNHVLLPEARPRAIMHVRSPPEGYNGVIESNIFSVE